MKSKTKVTAERHRGKIAIAEQQNPPINLLTVDAYFGFHDPELAGLAVVPMNSDSMAPILKSGDYALVDTRDTHVGAGTFAVLWDTGSVIITHVHRVYESGHSTGRVRYTFDNPVYGGGEANLDEDFQIVGRVVRKITRHL